MNDPRYIEHVKGGLARQLAVYMLEHGFCKFERGPVDGRQMRFGMRMTAGVVSTSQVATLEQRVSEHQEVLARAAMQEAQRQINNWGSDFGWSNIRKDDANRCVSESLGFVLKERAKWREV